MPRFRTQQRDFVIHQDSAQGAAQPPTVAPGLDDCSARTLTPASTGITNSMSGRGSIVAKQALGRSATIRSVPSLDESESSPDSKNSAFSSSVNSTASGTSMAGSTQNGRVPSLSRSKPSSSSTETPSKWNGSSPRVIEAQGTGHDSSVLSDGAEQESGQWDSTIGKAGLGKTGRVINKLVSDNDALKRDIQIERLKADEAKQAAKLVEDKMERMVSEYESRLLEANVTKTLLARKERQVETLTATVDTEKRKTVVAQERERTWRDEMEKTRTESAAQVDKATNHAQLMEGRYTAISSHWREQGDQVKRAVAQMRAEIEAINAERRRDDDKMQTLRDVCEQQDSNIRALRREKEDIARLFDEYRQTQEDDLRGIKTEGRRREQEQEGMLREAKEALDKLRWALNVKQKIDWAE